MGKQYVVKYQGKWMGFDRHSGGYPYGTNDLLMAHAFSSLEKAIGHVGDGDFSGEGVYELIVTTKKVDIKAAQEEQYQKELAKLNKKYGK